MALACPSFGLTFVLTCFGLLLRARGGGRWLRPVIVLQDAFLVCGTKEGHA